MGSIREIAEQCHGTGEAPRYRGTAGDRFELVAPGDPWRHADGRLGLGDVQQEIDAALAVGTFAITAPAIELRIPFSLRGRRSGFGNPNGEYPPATGTVLQFAKNGLQIGRSTRFLETGVDDRLSLPTVENLCLYRDPLATPTGQLGDGAAIWTDLPSDQLTISNVNISCCTYGMLNTTYLDAVRIRALHTGRVAFPLYFAPQEEARSSACWYGTVSDCCFADGDGPVVIRGSSHPWNFTNVLIVRQGRQPTHLPACNLYWGVNFGRFAGGAIDEPGETFRLNDGQWQRKRGRIDADGMIVEGNGNVITTFFRGAHGTGKANLRLKSGSNRNIIQSQFAGTHQDAVDLIIEPDCEDNVVQVVPGMSILDRGKNTRYIGGEWTGQLVRE